MEETTTIEIDDSAGEDLRVHRRHAAQLEQLGRSSPRLALDVVR